jgi:hypothetical protein
VHISAMRALFKYLRSIESIRHVEAPHALC